MVAEVPPPRSVGLLPAPRHRISPSRGQHIWPGLQAVWRQEMLLWMEQVQSREHVLSVYHFSPTCRERVSAEPTEAWKLERDGGLPPTHHTPGPPRGQLRSATRLRRQPFSSPRLLNFVPQPPALPLPTSLHSPSPLAPNSWRPPCSLASHRVVGAPRAGPAALAEGHTAGPAQDVASLTLAALGAGQRGRAVRWGAQAETGGRTGVSAGAVSAA